MTILVTGGSGTIGTQVVAALDGLGAHAKVLMRDTSKAELPTGFSAVGADMLDVDSMRAALEGVSTLFLLNAVVPDEFTQAILTLNLAREAGVNNVVYWSVIHSDVYVDVPHFAGKHAVERMIEKTGIAATILRPAYFMQNDAGIASVIVDRGVYPMPIGDKGLAMIDVRDAGEVAALELVARERSSQPRPLDTIDLVGPDNLTGDGIAAIWSEVLEREVTYGGDDPAPFEQNTRQFAPPWMAYDMRKMADRFVSDGMIGETGDVARLTDMLDRPLRSYRDFAREVATDRFES